VVDWLAPPASRRRCASGDLRQWVTGLEGGNQVAFFERPLTRLRGFEGYDEAKPLILRGADPKGRHYTGVVDATCVAVIFGGACGGRASLSFSNRSCSSGSGWV
jgi:hypothetical protein